MRGMGWARGLLVAIALVIFTGWVHLYQFSAALTDQAADSFVLLVLGKNVARGLVPYKDLWEMKPPGIFWYLGTIFSTLPMAMWSVRIVDYLVYVAAGFVFYHLCRIAGARRALALIGAACWLYFAHHPRFDLGGIFTEEYMAIFEVCCMAAAATYWRTRRSVYAMLSGAAAAAALLFKHPGIAVVVPALLLLSTSLNAVLWFGTSFILPIILVVAYFWHRGAFAQFMDCNVWFLIPYGGYSTGFPLAQRLLNLAQTLWGFLTESPALLGAAALGPLTCAFHPSRFRVAAVTWVAADFITIALQNKGFYVHNYLIQLFPSLFFAATLGAAFLFQAQPRERWAVSALRFVGVVSAVFLCWLPLKAAYAARQPAVRQQWKVLLAGPSAWQSNPAGPYENELGQYVRGHSTPDDRILVCGAGWVVGPSVSIYWTADRAPASRYFYPHMLTGFRIAENVALLEQAKPRYVIVTDCTGYLDKLQPWLRTNYRLEKSYTRPYGAEIWIRSEDFVPPPEVAAEPEVVSEVASESGVQLLEGVTAVVSAPHSAPSYADYRGGGPSSWAYVEDQEPEVTWRTAPAPARKRTVLALTVSSSPESGQAELYVNGRSVLAFPIGAQSAGGRWSANGYTVAFLSKGDFMGSSGILLIGVPPEAVTPGQALQLRVALTGAVPRAWFMVKGYQDTVAHEALSADAADQVLQGAGEPVASGRATH
jgi:hypothetical protein